ncbi:GMP reductase 1 isoform X2 [Pipistrellus kuhlii]|uniref:GMP reductase 1 isoform X2 n=1 Tax=Pipistrellus kuhlii TaxID=59472 RepID=UPI00174F65ED|nr:GMP reductase 1 isoform X2 [Pipistrellus kuhlii]
MPRIDADLKLDFKDVLLRPKRSSLKSRAEVDLERTFTFRNSKQTYSGIPIIVANMDTVGTFEMAAVMSQHSMFTAVHKHYTLDDWKHFAADHPECLQHVAVSSGSGKKDLEKMSSILEAVPQVKFICLDVANGYSEHFVEFVKLVRARFPEHTIMAGNVVTGEMVEELILSGADIIKVGVGPGSVCTTRTKTGVGYPQLSAVIECADSAHGLKGHIISSVGGQDGGSALQRKRRTHDPGYPGGTEVDLHLRGGRQTQRAQQEDDVHPGDPAAQHSVRLAWGRCRLEASTRCIHIPDHLSFGLLPNGRTCHPSCRLEAPGPLVPVVGQEAEH